MATFLFEDIIFGPVQSRRLGSSLGVNLLPVNGKVCNYNCIYCECGLTKENYSELKLPTYMEVTEAMEKAFSTIEKSNTKIDAITFAGNGEPTLSPYFQSIIDKTIYLRDKYLNDVKIVVLTNATNLNNKEVLHSLSRVDKALLKIDTVIQEDYELINCPMGTQSIDEIISSIYHGIDNKYIQTMFFRATINGKNFDNTGNYSLTKYLKALELLEPKEVMIYSIARDTPVKGLVKSSDEVLNSIAKKIKPICNNVLVAP